MHAEIVSLRHGAHPRTVAVSCGQAISLQMRSLERGVDARRARAIARVNTVAQDVGAEDSPLITLADEILAVTEARVALASCLSLAFAGSLDPERYRQIAEVERDRIRS